MQEFINSIITHLNSSINEFGSASIVTCGGSSPINIFKQLSSVSYTHLTLPTTPYV